MQVEDDMKKTIMIAIIASTFAAVPVNAAPRGGGGVCTNSPDFWLLWKPKGCK